MYIGLFLIVLAILFAVAGISSRLTKQPEPQPTGRVPRDAGPPPGDVPATPDEYVGARQRSQ